MMNKVISKIIVNLKLFFVPCPETDFRPKFLDSRFLVGIVVVLLILKLLIFPLFIFFPGSVFYANISKDVLMNLVNEERKRNALAPLKGNPVLDKAAELKSVHMLTNNYFSHNSPDGVTPWHWFGTVGYKYKTAGENLAIGFLDSAEVFTAWKSSVSHNANLLNPKFNEMGLAITRGNFQGQEVSLVVQTFGAPLVEPAKKVQPQTEAPKIETAKEQITEKPKLKTAQPLSTKEPEPKLTIQPTLAPEENFAEEPAEESPAQFPGEAGIVASDKTERPSVLYLGQDKIGEEAEESNFAFSLWKFMVTNYYDLIQKIIFYTLIFIIISLSVNIFVRLSIQRMDLLLKSVFFLVLLSVFYLFNKQFVLQLIPHNLMIF